MIIKDKQVYFEKILALLILIFSIIVIAMGMVYFWHGYAQSDNPIILDDSDKLIGGDKDNGGCLVAAGYSWCEVKQKCLRTWEEACINSDVQDMVELYIKQNISQLSPQKEVLGGKFYVTQFRFTGNDRVVVDYEDGHNALQTAIIFTIADGQVAIQKISLLSVNGSSPDNAGNSNFAATALTQLFSDKYNIAPNDINVQVTDDRGMYVRGNVKLSKDMNAGGGYFLAKMVDGQYQLIIDGNGQIDCGLVNDFPKDMVRDCVWPK